MHRFYKRLSVERVQVKEKVALKQMGMSLRHHAESISFIEQLMAGPVCSLEDPTEPPWFTPEHVYQIGQALYQYHADSENLRWAEDDKFVFAVDRQPFQFFWKNAGKYFARQLSEDESFQFCRLMNVKRK